MKHIRQLFSLFLVIGLLYTAQATACAAGMPTEGRDGTITVELAYGGQAVDGGTLTAYRVGQIQSGSDSFEKTDMMTGFDGVYDDIGSAALANRIAAFVKAHSLSAYATAKNQNGTALFPQVEPGLYLIVQTEPSEGYAPLNPFLVSMPMLEGGRYVYEVNARGKLQLPQEPEPTRPSDPENPPDPDQPDEPDQPDQPDQPGKPSQPGSPSQPGAPDEGEPNQPASAAPSVPTLPQTGQLNWPIPVLTVVGLCLFALGWKLRFGRKRGSDEG